MPPETLARRGQTMSSAAEPRIRGSEGQIRPTAPRRELEPLPPSWRSLPRVFVQVARRRSSRPAIADSTGASLTFGKALIHALVLGRVLDRIWSAVPRVGILLPPTVAGCTANLAVSLWGKVPVNLNYSTSQALVDASIEQCGITHILTSEKVLDRFKITPKGQLVLLENVRNQVRLVDKLWGAAVAKVVPLFALRYWIPGLCGDQLDAEATIIFTSGSTADPKGVVLSHRNILCNVRQIDKHVHLLPDEVLLGVLPFFHSFGFTVSIWTALGLGKKVVYHYNPLDARTVCKLCEEHKVTLLAGTPSFMRLYLKSCEPRQFQTLTHLILGAEKLKSELARDIEEKLAIEPMEGYGCTELSPVVAVNVPRDVELPDGRRLHGNRLGTVGLPVPGTSIKTIDPDTGADLPEGTEGVIAVKGPQVMVGYLDRPEATAEVIRDGWYVTGDIGYVDCDGFLKITDRISRFSKIAGEMVPHLSVESAIMEVTGVDEHHVAVSGVPDPKHGERLCVLYTDLGTSPGEVHRRLAAGPLPKVWIPSQRDFIMVPEIPITPTGKVDLRRLKELAIGALTEPKVAPHV
jgi:acyl-[acyl-carrier-protein]-phospholipid O-acyltransferase/long-chain-fatty-acid--[acyl-carrier-protein] ligase